MTKKLQIINFFVLFLLFALSNMAMAPSAQGLLSPTPTSVVLKRETTATQTVKPSPSASPSKTPRVNTPAPTRTKLSAASLAMQAGNSDWIAVIGILIVAIIVIPLLLKYKEWRG